MIPRDAVAAELPSFFFVFKFRPPDGEVDEDDIEPRLLYFHPELPGHQEHQRRLFLFGICEAFLCFLGRWGCRGAPHEAAPVVLRLERHTVGMARCGPLVLAVAGALHPDAFIQAQVSHISRALLFFHGPFDDCLRGRDALRSSVEATAPLVLGLLKAIQSPSPLVSLGAIAYSSPTAEATAAAQQALDGLLGDRSVRGAALFHGGGLVACRRLTLDVTAWANHHAQYLQASYFPSAESFIADGPLGTGWSYMRHSATEVSWAGRVWLAATDLANAVPSPRRSEKSATDASCHTPRTPTDSAGGPTLSPMSTPRTPANCRPRSLTYRRPLSPSRSEPFSLSPLIYRSPHEPLALGHDEDAPAPFLRLGRWLWHQSPMAASPCPEASLPFLEPLDTPAATLFLTPLGTPQTPRGRSYRPPAGYFVALSILHAPPFTIAVVSDIQELDCGSNRERALEALRCPRLRAAFALTPPADTGDPSAGESPRSGPETPRGVTWRWRWQQQGPMRPLGIIRFDLATRRLAPLVGEVPPQVLRALALGYWRLRTADSASSAALHLRCAGMGGTLSIAVFRSAAHQLLCRACLSTDGPGEWCTLPTASVPSGIG